MGYGDTEIVDIVEWIEDHGFVCDICRREPSGYRWSRLHLDHDEETGRIRGMLCPACNLSIGKFDHDIARLQAAIDYLRSDAVFEPGKVSW